MKNFSCLFEVLDVIWIGRSEIRRVECDVYVQCKGQARVQGVYGGTNDVACRAGRVGAYSLLCPRFIRVELTCSPSCPETRCADTSQWGRNDGRCLDTTLWILQSWILPGAAI
jgi:hypothetical protein